MKILVHNSSCFLIFDLKIYTLSGAINVVIMYKRDSASNLLDRSLQQIKEVFLAVVCLFIFKIIFSVLHCNFNVFSLPKLDVLSLDAALG